MFLRAIELWLLSKSSQSLSTAMKARRRTLRAAWSPSSWGPSCSSSAPTHDMSSRRSDVSAETPSAAPTVDSRAHPSTLQ